jgi:chromate transporter
LGRSRWWTDAPVWFRIGCLSFGGPAGQIALMQRLLVEELRWISPRKFLAGLDLCMLLPGPEAQQLATYVGWTRQGWRGGLLAGSLFVLPGATLMAVLAWAYVTWGDVAWVASLFFGLRCAVVAIVAQALVRIGRRALSGTGTFGIAAASFLALAFLRAPFPLLVALAGCAGMLLREDVDEPAPDGDSPAAAELSAAPSAGGAGGRRWGAPAAIAAAWAASLGAVVSLRGSADLLSGIGLRFAELAVFSFGGAYALLAALAERAVAEGWLSTVAMTDGLALAETTPGPLILVLEFVAFVAAHSQSVASGAGAVRAALSGGVAALFGTWILFAPSFVWIFLAAPHLDRLDRWPAARRALRGVGAAVVGVIANLSLYLAAHVLFLEVSEARWSALRWIAPRLTSIDPAALALMALAAALLFGARQSMTRTLALTACGGLLLELLVR